MPPIRRQLATFAIVLLGLYVAGFIAGTIIDEGGSDAGGRQEQTHGSGH